ncbi:MAG: cytochrome c biogenesis protein CcsA [Chitinophagales bacterium]|nr:cytochrome c biogenesis protein CcsA [Chitinophagales bacterium]HPR30325.1 cytochrome c biogenesis protein CcsA [Chitinophagales bacterium]HQU39949.1 cytochrome c biogenesis protein CcsA [Chitinophagales bacterium]HQU77031.1 cytochrome c biogenesis protein CcsA [Chitinophagales bacterium]HRX22758.1 cytochrome c biogenesis protein CcsA [Chitinophagales bacterium]
MINQLHKRWWKVLGAVLMLYTFTAGMMIQVPARFVLHETIRNLFFHVPVWFTMILLLLVSLVQSVRFLRTGKMVHDIMAAETAAVAVLFGCLGFLTGMLWGSFTWGDTFSWLFADTKILGAFIGLMIYAAYFILRGSINDEEKRARVAAVYSIFAYMLLIVFIFVIPRLTDSLHPGNGGNPAFSTYDLDNSMRTVFYPAVFAYFLTGLWIASLRVRVRILHYRKHHINVL